MKHTNHKILIIEDDVLTARMYQTVFEFEEFEVRTVRNGEEALEALKKEKPTLILLDIMMPKMSGIEVLEEIKAVSEYRKIPVVVLTNLSGTKDAEKALSMLEGKTLIIVGTDRERFSSETMNKCNDNSVSVVFSHETDYQYSTEMKTAFRRFGQGMKVVVEDVVIACLTGILKIGVDVISIAGSSRGADTAVVINTASNFSTVKIKEVICMPS